MVGVCRILRPSGIVMSGAAPTMYARPRRTGEISHTRGATAHLQPGGASHVRHPVAAGHRDAGRGASAAGAGGWPDTTEYAILLGFLAIAIIVALFFLRGVLRSLFLECSQQRFAGLRTRQQSRSSRSTDDRNIAPGLPVRRPGSRRISLASGASTTVARSTPVLTPRRRVAPLSLLTPKASGCRGAQARGRHRLGQLPSGYARAVGTRK